MDRTENVGRTALALPVIVALLVGAVGFSGPAVGETPNTQHPTATDNPGHAAIDVRVEQTGDRNRITIESTTGERSFYEVRVTGSIAFGQTANPVDAEFVDSIGDDNATASGSVAGGSDDFLFTGELAAVEVDGPATVSVNGETIDPDEIETSTETETETEPTTETLTETTTTTPTTTTTTTETMTTDTTTTDPTTETTTTTTTTTELTTATSTETTATPTTSRTTTEDSATPTETTTETSTETTSEPTSTANPTTADPTTETTTREPLTTANSGQPPGFGQAERGLILTIGGVLLLGIVVIGGFALLVRR